MISNTPLPPPLIFRINHLAKKSPQIFNPNELKVKILISKDLRDEFHGLGLAGANAG